MTSRAGGYTAALASAALAALLLLPGLGEAPFDDPGEGQHAQIAREAGASGDWLTLRLNGVRYLDKPPLLYWLVAHAFALAEPPEKAARLVPALGAALAAAGTAALGARLLGPLPGLFAAAALLSSALFFAFGRYVRPETLFAAAIQWGFVGLLWRAGDEGDARDPAAERRGRPWAMLGALALGLASLSKDPLGLVGPLAAVALARHLAGRLRPVGAWLPPAALAALVLVGFGWHAMAAAASPGSLWYAVVDNHLLNLARLRRFPDEDVPLSVAEFLTVSALGVFPWILPAALAVGDLVRRRAWRDPRELPWVALALWSAGGLAALAAAPFRLPHYALPAYPAICLLAVRAWRDRAGRGLIAAHLALFLLVALGCALAAASDGRAFVERVFPAVDVQARKEAALGQPGPLAAWPALEPLLGRTALVFAAGSLGLAAALVRGAAGWGLPVTLLTMLAVMPAVAAGTAAVASTRAVRALAAEVARLAGPDDLLAHEGPLEGSGALELYSGRRPVLLDARRSVLGFGATFPDGRDAFWDVERFRAAWLSPRRVLLVTARPPAQSVTALLPPARLHLLATHNGRRLYANGGPGATPGAGGRREPGPPSACEPPAACATVGR